MSSLFSKTISLHKEQRIADDEFVNLRGFIYEQSGIFVGDNRKYLLENRLENRLRDLGLKNFSEYFYYLKYDPGRDRELGRLFEVITTNETSFYRNPPQLAVFQDTILPAVLDGLRKSGSRSLRIWSAGCSTGEEPYTLSILVHEVLRGDVGSWDVRIMANDLSEGVLHSARRGIYSEYAMRTTPQDIIGRYFEDEGNGRIKIKSHVRDLVQFGQINLSDRAQIKRVERSHIAFCRNVIIYFDDEMKRQVIAGLYDNIMPGGYLFIGHSESLHNLSRAFKPVHHPGSIVYKKEG